MKHQTKFGGALTIALALSAGSASALTITQVTADPESTLISALMAPGSGINVVAGSEFYQGNLNMTGGGFTNVSQSGTYTDFVLAPSSGSTPTLTLPNGIVLTAATAALPNTNTTNQFNPVTPGTGPNANLGALSASAGGTNVTNDANTIKFDFTLADPSSVLSVAAEFVFGTDEFPTQSVTDIFGFFVDGVNYAQFPSGELISNTPGNPTNFILNPVGGGLYPIEYNGLSQAFHVVGLLDPNLDVHTIEIAVADTSDTIYDSGVFIGGLTASDETGGGIIDPPNGETPAPATLALLSLGLLGFGLRRKRAK